MVSVHAMARLGLRWGCAALLALPALLQAQYAYTTNNGTITITWYAGAESAVTVPSTINDLPVTRIGEWAFASSVGLQRVTLPASVTNIANWVFYGCPSLTSIAVAPLNPAYSSVDGVLFSKPPTTLLACPGGASGSYAVPDGVTNIADYAFHLCKGLPDVTLPDGLLRIGNRAFDGCEGLAGIAVPDSVTHIGDWAFHWCVGLIEATLGRGLTHIGAKAFGYCIALAAIDVDPLNSAFCSVDGVVFDRNQTTLLVCPSGRSGDYAIPDGITGIADGAFYWCFDLAGLAIPASVRDIGDGAFEGCCFLPSVTVPDGVTCIGDRTFYWCASLTRVSLPDSVTSIGDEAFAYCFLLESLYCRGDAPAMGDTVFTGTDDVTIFRAARATGWTDPWHDRPVVVWNPQVSTSTGFGLGPDGFGFTLANTGAPEVVIEACTCLVAGAWSPVATAEFVDGTARFDDSDTAAHPGRFYRLRMP